MKQNVLAIRVDSNVYTRRNNDADIAGCIVAMISNLVTLRYSKECAGLINHYNFVEIPDTEFATKIVRNLCEFLDVTETYIMGLIEVVFLPVAE